MLLAVIRRHVSLSASDRLSALLLSHERRLHRGRVGGFGLGWSLLGQVSAFNSY